MTSVATNHFETTRRLVKAEVMAETLMIAGITLEQVQSADDGQWAQLAEICTRLARKEHPRAQAFHAPSDETKQLVFRLMRLASCTCDPFVIPGPDPKCAACSLKAAEQRARAEELLSRAREVKPRSLKAVG